MPWAYRPGGAALGLCLSESEAIGAPLRVGSAVRDLLGMTPLARLGDKAGMTEIVRLAEEAAGVEYEARPRRETESFHPEETILTRSEKFRELLRKPPFVCMGAHDAVTAMLAEQAGAPAIYVRWFRRIGHRGGQARRGVACRRPRCSTISAASAA